MAATLMAATTLGRPQTPEEAVMSRIPTEIALIIMRYIPNAYFHKLPLRAAKIKERAWVNKQLARTWRLFRGLIWSFIRIENMRVAAMTIVRDMAARAQAMKAEWENMEMHWTVGSQKWIPGPRPYTNGKPARRWPYALGPEYLTFHPHQNTFDELVTMETVEAFHRAHRGGKMRDRMVAWCDRMLYTARAHGISI